MSSSHDTVLLPNPIQQFQRWFVQAHEDRALEQPEAMCLSTVSAKGRPSGRMVLLKDAGPLGFTFFTNIHSPKARDLKARRYAALTFYWPSQHRQIRVEGKVVEVPKKEADAYFVTRPRESQIGSWASRQSEPLKTRAELLHHFDEWAKKFEGQIVPPSTHWHGFRVIPERIEFWQERPYRLHDRWVYVKKSKSRWAMMRLYP